MGDETNPSRRPRLKKTTAAVEAPHETATHAASVGRTVSDLELLKTEYKTLSIQMGAGWYKPNEPATFPDCERGTASCRAVWDLMEGFAAAAEKQVNALMRLVVWALRRVNRFVARHLIKQAVRRARRAGETVEDVDELQLMFVTGPTGAREMIVGRHRRGAHHHFYPDQLAHIFKDDPDMHGPDYVSVA